MPPSEEGVAEVAVLHPSPSFRRGLESVLATRRRVVVDSDPTAAWTSHRDCAVVIYVEDPSSWEALKESAQRAVTVALLAERATHLYSRALTCGAAGIAWANDDPESIGDVLDQACDGNVLIPLEVMRDLLEQTPDDRGADSDGLSEPHRTLIRSLAGGTTLVQFARDGFISERTARRMLAEACKSLGVETRSQAIAKASRLGLI